MNISNSLFTSNEGYRFNDIKENYDDPDVISMFTTMNKHALFKTIAQTNIYINNC